MSTDYGTYGILAGLREEVIPAQFTLVESGVNANKRPSPVPAAVGRVFCTPYNCSPRHSTLSSYAGGRPLSLEVIQYPHPTLRHVSRRLKKVDAELKQIIAEMFDLMYAHDGVGLAANQVDLPYPLVRRQPRGRSAKKDAEFVFINPVLRKGSGQAEDEEGCLSIPGVYAPVVRKEKIDVQAYNLAGKRFTAKSRG